MVTVAYSTRFEKEVRKIRDTLQKERIKAQIIRIVQDPWDRKTNALGPEKYEEGVRAAIPALVLLW